MSVNDPWITWIWDVFAAQGPGAPYEKPSGTTIGHFSLTAAIDPVTQSPCYVVSPLGLVMPMCWSDPRVRFYLRGTLLPTNVPNIPLPAWSSDPNVDELWTESADSLRSQLPTGVRHLEGVMYPDGSPETMYLVRLDDATVNHTPLLAMHLSPQSGITPFQDGTAHGGGH